MKIDEISALWKADCGFDITDLATSASNVPLLHAKYYELFALENMVLSKFQCDYKVLYKTKLEYYSGRLSDEDRAEKGWDPMQLRVLKQDLDTYIEADLDIINFLLKLAVQQEKVDYLKEIVKSLNNRGFLLRTAMDWVKFTQGC